MERGKLTVIGGPMFAGKTTRLQEYVRGMDECCVVAVKPSIDVRYDANRIVNHAEVGGTHHVVGIPAAVVNAARPQLMSLLHERSKLMAIDESNFFTFSILFAEVTKVLDSGRDVVVAGLLYDASREPFGATLGLMEHADEKIVLSATCYSCGGQAAHTKRLFKTTTQIVVGGADKYVPSCDACWSLT